jgi:hypothetical protein
LIGDGETAEGSVWEAADVASIDGLDNLCAITDVNALGQSRATMWRHDLEQFARRWRAFGWHAITIDGHDLNAILDALRRSTPNVRPSDDDRGEDAQGQKACRLPKARTAGTAGPSRKARNWIAPLRNWRSSGSVFRQTSISSE